MQLLFALPYTNNMTLQKLSLWSVLLRENGVRFFFKDKIDGYVFTYSIDLENLKYILLTWEKLWYFNLIFELFISENTNILSRFRQIKFNVWHIILHYVYISPTGLFRIHISFRWNCLFAFLYSLWVLIYNWYRNTSLHLISNVVSWSIFFCLF